ncbi:hypothetical protein HDV63DRAFT_345322 [Trichoderma sp. SZMC 28014]
MFQRLYLTIFLFYPRSSTPPSLDIPNGKARRGRHYPHFISPSITKAFPSQPHLLSNLFTSILISRLFLFFHIFFSRGETHLVLQNTEDNCFMRSG